MRDALKIVRNRAGIDVAGGEDDEQEEVIDVGLGGQMMNVAEIEVGDEAGLVSGMSSGFEAISQSYSPSMDQILARPRLSLWLTRGSRPLVHHSPVTSHYTWGGDISINCMPGHRNKASANIPLDKRSAITFCSPAI